jgi:hypothetical protein
MLLVAVVVPIAVVAAGRWLWALAAGTPVLYGEGAVANAALLARDRIEYGAVADPGGPIFVAANYPPLFFHLAGLGDPLRLGRLASIASALFVAGAIAWTAYRRAGRTMAVAIAGVWLASIPVVVWGAAVKPDLLALALTVGAVMAASGRRRPLLSGALIALAVWTKPTAALPAVALGAYLAAEGGALLRYLTAGAIASAAVLVFAWTDPRAMFEHVVSWNALPWHADQVVLLVALALLTFAAPLVAYAMWRPRGALAAYGLAGVALVALGGREGATMNYLLDLSAATALGLASVADRLAPRALVALASATQLAVALVMLDPFGLAPGRAITSGAWASPDRLAAVHAVRGDLLVEDAGLLVADGRRPRVDDLFLISRLMAQRELPEGEALIRAIRDAEFDAVVSEVDLAQLSTAPAYERQRWDARIVKAVLARYRLSSRTSGLYIYVRAAP